MMRRWGDQSNPGGGMTHSSNDFVHLVSRQLSAFSRLGSLGHFYLQVIGIHQVLRGHAKTRRGNLLNRATAPIAVGIAFEAFRIFAALPRVAFRTNAVH